MTNSLLAGLGFSVGFLALLLGRSELFTDGFLVPVTTVAANRASPAQLLKLWSRTLVADLADGWVLMALIMTGFPKLHERPIPSWTRSRSSVRSSPAMHRSATPSPGNIVGGLLLVTVLRLLRSKERLHEERAEAEAE